MHEYYSCSFLLLSVFYVAVFLSFFYFFFVLFLLLKSTWLVFSSSAVCSNFCGYRCASGESGRAGSLKALVSGVSGQNPGKFWLFCILNSSKHGSRRTATTNGGESSHQKSTLLRIWGSEFGIPNRYTGFKIALDTALSRLSADFQFIRLCMMLLLMDVSLQEVIHYMIMLLYGWFGLSISWWSFHPINLVSLNHICSTCRLQMLSMYF